MEACPLITWPTLGEEGQKGIYSQVFYDTLR